MRSPSNLSRRWPQESPKRLLYLTLLRILSPACSIRAHYGDRQQLGNRALSSHEIEISVSRFLRRQVPRNAQAFGQAIDGQVLAAVNGGQQRLIGFHSRSQLGRESWGIDDDLAASKAASRFLKFAESLAIGAPLQRGKALLKFGRHDLANESVNQANDARAFFRRHFASRHALQNASGRGQRVIRIAISGRSMQTLRSLRGGKIRSRTSFAAVMSPARACLTTERQTAAVSPSSSCSAITVAWLRTPAGRPAGLGLWPRFERPSFSRATSRSTARLPPKISRRFCEAFPIMSYSLTGRQINKSSGKGHGKGKVGQKVRCA